MIIFAGHHMKAQGAVNGKSSEFIESVALVEAIAINSNLIRGDYLTTKEKLNTVNTLCDSLSIEIHYNTSLSKEDGPVVYYKPDCDKSKAAATHIQNELNEVSKSNNVPKIGYYHDSEEFGIDYFLTSKFPAIIICPEHWDNYETIKRNRGEIAKAITNGLDKIIVGL